MLILFYNIAYTGCLIYPLTVTCFENFYWSMDIERIESAAVWYELWSKAGATPNYRVDDPINYIKGLNWLGVWIDNYFFNKVSDTIGGIILTVFVFLIIFKPKRIKFTFNSKYNIILILLFFLFIEWFFYHPSLRYGGYHLLALLFFIPSAIILGNQNYSYSKNFKKINIILLIGITIFSVRNIDRIIDENKIYNYNPIKSPRYNINKKDYYLKIKKEEILQKTNQCKNEFKKDSNCEIVNSYRIFY